MTFGIFFLISIGCLGIISTLRIILIERDFADKFGGKLEIHPIRGWILPDGFELSNAASAYLEKKKRSVAMFNAASVAGFLILFAAWLVEKNLRG